MTQFGPLDRPDRYYFQISKIQDSGARYLEKSKNRHITTAVEPIFGTVTQLGLLDRSNRSDR